MLKRLALVFLWLLITPVVIAFSGISVYQQKKVSNLLDLSSTQIPLEAKSPNQVDGQVLGVAITDQRPYLIANFLKNTQLEPYSQQIVETSDKYGIDYRLIPAIAMKETGGGNKAREDSYNAWGFENGNTNFNCWEEAIDKVGKTLKEKYIAKGLTTPEEIMTIYAPPQIFTGGKWAKDINFFFSKLEAF